MNTQNVNQVTETQVQPTPSFPDAFEEAYKRRLEEIQAVPDDELVATNLDIPGVVATVLGTLPEVRSLRAEMARVPQLDQELVDALEDYARATGEAAARYGTATAPRVDIIALNEAAVKQREQLRTDALALASRGLVDRARLGSFNGLLGYKNVAFELIEYATILRDSWSAINGKTPLTLEEIHDAKELGMQLLEAAGLREQAPIVAAEAAKIRQQAFTLLSKAYDEVRRAVGFLRWREDDADSIAPSLYAGHGGRKRTDAQAPTASTAPTGASTPATGGAATPATGAAATTPATGAAAPAAASAAAPVAPGLPGHNPFL